MVRDEWFALCNQMPAEQLLQQRVGGAGSILYTFFKGITSIWIRELGLQPVSANVIGRGLF
ncbi:hypothetical protein GON22_06060 [Paenibacillus sp. MMS18-CY102]|nr:hypothetical protein [Paenibacillus sp. MMS18-CY102]